MTYREPSQQSEPGPAIGDYAVERKMQTVGADAIRGAMDGIGSRISAAAAGLVEPRTEPVAARPVRLSGSCDFDVTLPNGSIHTVTAESFRINAGALEFTYSDEEGCGHRPIAYAPGEWRRVRERGFIWPSEVPGG